MNLEQIICEARCCSANIGAKYANAATYGEATEELWWDLLRINAYIRTLERNLPRHIHIKEKVQLKSVDIGALEKIKSFLTLRNKEKVVCKTIEIEPCLSEADLCKIVEHIRLLCATCNCNCN